MSWTAFITDAGLMLLPAPRSSPAPHFDGQRSFSAGGDQVGACANAAPHAVASAKETAAAPIGIVFMIVPPSSGIAAEANLDPMARIRKVRPSGVAEKDAEAVVIARRRSVLPVRRRARGGP